MKITPRIIVVAIIAFAGTVTAEILLIDRTVVEAPLPYAGFPGFWTLFGLLWAFAFGLGMKWLGHAFLMRHGNPYEEGGHDEHKPPLGHGPDGHGHGVSHEPDAHVGHDGGDEHARPVHEGHEVRSHG